MSKNYGIMVNVADDGAVTSNKIKQYVNYEEMVADLNPGKFGIIEETNTVYHYQDGSWVIGFPTVANSVEYTAFEVYAHDTEIPFGYCEELGGTIEYYKPTTSSKTGVTKHPADVTGIPPQMTHKFLIRGNTPQNDQDVIVDWGDGTIDDLKTIVPTSLVDDRYKSSSYTIVYGMSHTYQKPGKYIVKVYGSTYQHLQYDEEVEDGKDCNLICRVFDTDLPIASHLNNFDALCKYAIMLTSVNVGRASSGRFLEGRNCSDCFSYCYNLESATGFNKYAQFRYIAGLFFRCHSLKYTDIVIPAWCYACGAAFFENINLEVDINKVLPNDSNSAWQCTKVSIDRAFFMCEKLYGTVPAEDLWNSDHTKFYFSNKTFGKTSAEFMAQVPASWGGTASDDIITVN